MTILLTRQSEERERERGRVWWRGSYSFLAQKERVSECLQRSHSVRGGEEMVITIPRDWVCACAPRSSREPPGPSPRMRTEVDPRLYRNFHCACAEYGGRGRLAADYKKRKHGG